MSNRKHSAPEKPAPQTEATLTTAQVLQAIKENFVLVSAAAIVIGVGLSTTFLAAYLSEFDWHLLLFVQYTDIITFGLIAVGVLSGFVMFVQVIAQTFVSALQVDSKTRRRPLIITGVILVLFFVFNIGTAIYRGQPYFHILFGASTMFLGIILVLFVVNQAVAGTWPSGFQAVLFIFLTAMTAASCGQWLGTSVKERTDFNQDVYVKDQTITDAKLVIMMSRHTVLLKDDVLYVVPTGDITKFRTADKNANLKFVPEE